MTDPSSKTQVPPRAGKRPAGPGRRPAPPRNRQARQAAQRRNRLLAMVSVVVVVAVVAVIVVIGVTSGTKASGTVRAAAPAPAVATVTNLPMGVITGASQQYGGLNPAIPAVGPDGKAGAPLTASGKPELLFIGAEFCPICAAERWAMVIALSKFGTFTNLQQTHSALTDGNIGTWSFYGATYTSPYLTFVNYEAYTNQPSGGFYKSLQKVPADASAIWAANEGGASNEAFPFLDFGGKYVLTSAQYNPTLIENRSFNSILSAVGHNDNTVGADIDASAAVLTKYICSITGAQPSSVCSATANVPLLVSNSRTGSSTPAGG